MSNTAELAVSKPRISSDVKHFLFLLIAVGLGALAYFAPFMTSEVGRRAFAITILMLTMYITETTSLAVTSLTGCLLYWVWAGIPLSKSFAGFFNDTPWYVLGVLLLGVMADSTGLARRLAYNIICRLGSSYGRLLAGMMILNFLLTFIMPSANAKVLILCTIAIGMLESFGMGKDSRIGRGLVLAMTVQAGMFSVFVIAGAAAILAKGLIESAGKVQVTYGMWLVAFLPIWILTIVASWFLIMKMYPPEKRMLEGGEEYCRAQLAKMGPISKREIKAMLILGVATLLWVTDHWHHISAAKVGLAAGLFACMPLVGGLKKEEFAKANFPIVIFIAGAMCMGTVMADTEILKTLTAALFKWMTPVLSSASVTAPVLMYWYNNIFHLFLGNESSLLVATLPALMQFCLKEGFNPLAVGMLWTFATGGKVFLYQMSALATGYSFGYFTTRDLFKIGVALFFVESFLLLIILPWYWPLIGLSWR